MRITALMSLIPFAGALAPLPVLADQASSCAVETLQKNAPAGTTIAAAKVVPATDKLPAHCLVDGSVATSGNTVDFRLGLPAQWNGKFFFQGVGGFAGSMGRLDAGLARGYASATTDTGHQGSSGTDGSWALNNRPKEIDYGHRGTHVTAVAAKSLTGAFFGKAPNYAYFSGCSNGGRQALMEAQRYPDDFDGIVAGDPSFGALGYVRRAITYQFMLASPDRVLPPAKLDVLSKAAVAACDAADGVIDGLVGDPRLCKFDPGPLECKGADAPDCLTTGQVASVKAIYSESKTPNGERIFGFPVGHEGGNSGWPLWITGRSPAEQRPDGTMTFGAESPTGYRFADGFFRYMAFEKDDPDYDWRAFDISRDLPKIATIAEILSPTDADLGRFQKSGGKLLLYHGWADPAISAYGTIAYYDKAVRKAGGKAAADNFVRLFLAPGMHHCRGGPGPDDFDTLTALERWVEKGEAPVKLIASKEAEGKVVRSRPLCPEPQRARYTGSGSIDDAANFRCQ
jgi:feruloyl esterase